MGFERKQYLLFNHSYTNRKVVDLMRKQKGFTLIELMAAMAIMMLLLAGVYTVADSGNLLYRDGYHKESINHNIKTALNSLSISIKSARVIDFNLDDEKYDNIDEDILKKIAYIESSDGSRFIYAIKNIDSKNSLVKITFNRVPRNKFEVDDSAGSLISEEFKSEFIKEENPNLVEVQSGDIEELASFTNVYDAKYIMYEKYVDENFLIAENKATNRYHRFPLIKKDNDDFEIVDEIIVAEYIEDVEIQERADEYCEITVKEKYYKKDLGRYTEMELSTIVHIVNYRGAL